MKEEEKHSGFEQCHEENLSEHSQRVYTKVFERVPTVTQQMKEAID